MSWQKDRAVETGMLDRHCKDVQAKLDEALEALGKLSRGYGVGNDQNHALNMQRLASDSLVKIGKMKQAEKPYIWWSR